MSLTLSCFVHTPFYFAKTFLPYLFLQSYEKPLLDSSPPILEKEKVKAIFYRVRGIYQCHLMFQIALASRVKNWDEMQQIGDVFVASVSTSSYSDFFVSRGVIVCVFYI